MVMDIHTKKRPPPLLHDLVDLSERRRCRPSRQTEKRPDVERPAPGSMMQFDECAIRSAPGPGIEVWIEVDHGLAERKLGSQGEYTTG